MKNVHDHLFQFEYSEVLRKISELNRSKNGTFKNIPFNRLKEISEVCALYLTKIRNKEMFEKNQLSDNLKLADVAPVLKKKI